MAHVSHSRRHGNPLVFLCLQERGLEMVKFLLESHASGEARYYNVRALADAPDPKSSITPLMAAVLRPHFKFDDAVGGNEAAVIKLAKMLIAHGARVDTCDSVGGSYPVHTAAQEGMPKVLRFLLDLGATMHRPTANLTTTIYIAALYGHVECVAMLCAVAAARGQLAGLLDQPSRLGRTPLAIAVEFAHPAAAALLIRFGADLRRASSGYYSRADPKDRACLLRARVRVRGWAAVSQSKFEQQQ